ncbi:DUF4421 family protein [Catalinimonas niigatensis]|uniref:DUF4421 family protein n=1 Tax=Catalinimonas niigatensis TaxID=1397264 RepID=UPI0026665986|nr:DUF4421 family protein [Catalinimonas niigatensis]WPP49359.1 DUF4421 family protein [Catalinimonas niigatensis]
MPLKPFFIRLAFTFFCLFIYASRVFAQDEAYVQTFKDTLNVKFIITNRTLNTSLQGNEQDKRMKLAPNQLSYLGIGGYIWGIGFQLHQALPIGWFYDNELLDDSRVFDFQGTLFRNKWLLDGGYQSYQNLYISNPDDFADGQALMSGEQFDLRRMLGTVTYALNGRRLAFKSAFNLNHRQLQSAGSGLLTAGYAYTRLKSENPALSSIPIQEALPSAIRGVSFLLRPGYAYHFVYRKFYLHTSAAAGLALQYQTYTRAEVRQNNWGLAPSYNLRGSLGYDNGRYFASLLGVFYRTSLEVEELHLRENAHNIQLMVGYRFAEPKWLLDRKPAILKKLQ